MRKIKIWIFVLAVASAVQVSGLRAQNPESIFTSFQGTVEYLYSNYDGSITVRSWGTGRNRSAALDQAYKNALNQVLFHGIDARGLAPDMSAPLLLENNAERKYQYFFNDFFSRRGDYKKFVSKEDTRGGSNVRQKSQGQVRYGVTVRVLRSDLKQYLIDKNIINP